MRDSALIRTTASLATEELSNGLMPTALAG